MGRADRHVPRVRRRDRQRRRASPAPTRNKNGIGNGAVVRPRRRRRRREQQLARGAFVPADCGRTDREYAQTDLAGNDAQLGFTGKSQLAIADFVWKWAPNGNAQRHQLQAAGRVLLAARSAAISPTTATARSASRSTSNYSSRQSGWYVAGRLPVHADWRVGARYDRLDPGQRRLRRQRRLPRAATRSIRSATSVMLDCTPSEFSRFRVQCAAEQDRGRTSPTTSSSSNTS